MAGPNPLTGQVIAQVQTLVGPLLESRRIELVDLAYRREGPQTVLRFIVDTAAGITIGECSTLSRAIEALLDEHDVIPERYCLEIASPGLDRRLKTPRDFERVIGRRVEMALREPLNGLHDVVGTVVSVGADVVTVQLDQGERLRVPLGLIAWARQEISFK